MRWHCDIRHGTELLHPAGVCGEVPSWREKKRQGRERTYVRIILLLVRRSCHGAVSGLDFSCLYKAHNAVRIHV